MINRKNKLFDIHGPVFYPASFIIIGTIIISFFFSETIVEIFSAFQQAASDSLGWFFILSTNIYVIAGLFFALSKYGNIRLGGPTAEPDFSTFSWFSMLFFSWYWYWSSFLWCGRTNLSL